MTAPATPNDRARLMILCAALVFALTVGLRQSLPLFISPINTATGLGLSMISFAFGVGQLAWGIAQPIAGALTPRYGNGRVLTAGALMIVAGTALTPFATSGWMLVFAIGILGAAGAGIAGPAVLLAAISARLEPKRRAMASSLVNAGGSVGQFVVIPVAQVLITGTGWVAALLILAAASAAIIPISRILWTRPGEVHPASMAETSVRVRDAVRDPNFALLSVGFFVCGFHVAFIATHLPGVVAACGLPPSVGAWSLALVGLFNVAGSIGIGWAMSRWRSKSLLSLLYLSRAVAIVAFLAAPKTPLTFAVFAAVIGASYFSTLPPTAGLVGKSFGLQNMATLFGLVMLAHQVGGFLGAWLGGRVFDLTGAYDWMWYADIVLAVFAALVHLPIREKAMRVAVA